MHPSVRQLLASTGSGDPASAIRERARALVRDATALGWQGPPFSMFELASARGLKVVQAADLTDDQDACVVPGRVFLNQRKPAVRQRYSLAHEIAHTLFPDYEVELHRAGRLWRRDGDDSEVERLCQVGAAELLFPLHPFLDAIARCGGTSLSTVFALATEFDASLEAGARRMVETGNAPIAMLVLRPLDDATGGWFAFSPGDSHAPHAHLAVWSAALGSQLGSTTVPHRACPPKGSAAERAWKAVVHARSRVVITQRRDESWGHAGLPGHWLAEAVTLPRGSKVPREVLCLLRREADEMAPRPS